jgi:predicted permease
MEFANSGYKGAPLEQVKQDVLRRARAIPGVSSASLALLTPMGGMSWNDFVVVPGVSPRTQKDSLVYFNQVSDGYFTTLGTTLLSGRDITADDITQKRRVAVVNETMARRWFGGSNPIGRTFQTPSGDTLKPPIEVVGLVRDTKYQRIDEGTFAIAYLPHDVNEPSGSYVQLVLRTNGAPSALVPADVNSRISLDITTLEAQVDASLARPRLLATLSGFMGALALVLAVIGLYGMMSYDVERRRNEIGIRKALGAPTPQLWRMVAGEASRLIGAGVVIGALIALASTRLMSAFLFGLTARDPATFIFAAVLLGVSGMLAASLPAWRAARLDPMEALREE